MSLSCLRTSVNTLLLFNAGWHQLRGFLLASFKKHPCDRCLVVVVFLPSEEHWWRRCCTQTAGIPGRQWRLREQRFQSLSGVETHTSTDINIYHQLYTTVILMRDTSALSMTSQTSLRLTPDLKLPVSHQATGTCLPGDRRRWGDEVLPCIQVCLHLRAISYCNCQFS